MNTNQQNKIIKVCTKCSRELPATVEYFYKNKKAKDDLTSQCKECNKTNKDKKREYDKIYREKNKEKIKILRQEYYKLNKNKRLVYNKSYIRKKALYGIYKNNQSLKLSEQIRRDPKDKELLQVKCAYCDRWMNPTAIQVLSRVKAIEGRSKGELRFYCNDNNNSCRNSCPIYGQVKYPKGFKKGTSREVNPVLRQMVLARDNYTCQKCEKTIKTVQLHVHHVKSYSQNKILGNDPDNCMVLCKECHKKVHELPNCKYNDLKCKNK